MPLVLAMAGLSREIVSVLLGEEWIEVAIIFKVLAFAAMFQPLVSTTGWIYTSMGQTKRMFYWGLISLPFFVLSFIVGLRWGPLGVATSYTTCFILVLMVPCLCFAFKYSHVSFARFLNAMWRPMAISLIVYGAIELTRYSFAKWNPILILLFSGVVGVLVFSLSLIFWPRARAEALDTIEIVKMIRK